MIRVLEFSCRMDGINELVTGRQERHTFRMFSYKCCKVFNKVNCLFTSWPNPFLGQHKPKLQKKLN